MIFLASFNLTMRGQDVERGTFNQRHSSLVEKGSLGPRSQGGNLPNMSHISAWKRAFTTTKNH